MLRRSIQLFAVLYLSFLIALIAAFRFIGEGSWILLLALYFPRLLFAVPLLLLLPLTWWKCSRRWLLAPMAAILLCLFPLMGLTFHFPTPRPSGNGMRIVSYNVWFGHLGGDEILRAIGEFHPDVLVTQATNYRVYQQLRHAYPTFHDHVDAEFVIFSRYPIKETVLASPVGPTKVEPFVRYTLETPSGLVDLLSVHPFSPRAGIETLRGQGFLSSLKDHIWPNPKSRSEVESNRDIRIAQVQAIADATRKAKHPVILAGDTNLPTLSSTFDRYLSHFQDGFTSVGNGFGYTFPAHKFPWMRIDRILADNHFRFSKFSVGSRRGSDHCPVFAVVEWKQ